MKKLTIILPLLLVFVLALSACSQEDLERNSLIPRTGEGAPTASDNANANSNDNLNNNDNPGRGRALGRGQNDNLNDNYNDNGNRNDNLNNNGNFNNNDNGRAQNDNFNDNGSRGLFGGGERERSLHRSSELDGYTVVDTQGRSIGEIESLLVEPGSGQIGYAVLRAHRELDLEREYLVVPWEALEVRQDERRDGDDLRWRRDLVFRHDTGLAAGAPSFSGSDLDTLDRTGWDPNVAGYWNQHGEGIPLTGEEGRQLVRLDPDNIDLVDRDGDRIGVVNDLILDVPGGRVTHAAVRSGSIFNPEYTLVPFESLLWDMESRRFAANFDRLDDYPRYRSLDEIPDPAGR